MKNSPEAAESAGKKAPFYRRILPWRGDGVREAARKTVLLFLCCVFLVSAFFLLRIMLFEPMTVQKESEDIRRIYYADSSSPSGTPAQSAAPESAVPAPTFEDLRKINSDIVGWVSVPGTVIDYPVLQSDRDAPEYYLKRNYLKKYSGHGSIFLSADCDAEKGRNLVLYGHSMNDGQMFAALLKYDLDAYLASPVVGFDTAEQKSQWKIISIFKTNTLPEQGEVFHFTRTDFSSDADYMNYVYQLRIRSIVDAPVDFRADDRIVTLSTCSYEFKDFRTVVVARQVREGEDASVDTQKASANGRAVYPDCWYEKYGGKKPEWPATLEEAVQQGLAGWAG